MQQAIIILSVCLGESPSVNPYSHPLSAYFSYSCLHVCVKMYYAYWKLMLSFITEVQPNCQRMDTIQLIEWCVCVRFVECVSLMFSPYCSLSLMYLTEIVPHYFILRIPPLAESGIVPGAKVKSKAWKIRFVQKRNVHILHTCISHSQAILLCQTHP